MAPVSPAWRVRVLRDEPPQSDGGFVLYWMIAARRASWNFALDRAVDWADELDKPLLVLEDLRCGYQWASDRFHRFIGEGMRDNRDAFATARVDYYPYMEPEARQERGLLEALAAHASVVVTDRSPVFDLASLVERAISRVRVRFEAVDSYGIVPMDAPASVFPTAHAFRRYLQRSLREFLPAKPRAVAPSGRDRGLVGPLPSSILERWPKTDLDQRLASGGLADFAIDHRIGPSDLVGGHRAAGDRLTAFIKERLPRYEERSHPDADVASGLSPYLHFGHVSPHEVLFRVLEADGWSPRKLAASASGSREGWWGASAPVEAFLDQLVTWRELGGNAARRPDFAQYEAIPEWARTTLEAHAADPRAHVYELEQFLGAATHDRVWNAAQRELVRDGRLHNYMRMLWGKKIIEWTRTPREALAVMIELNNRFALDGRDPNSYSGIQWTLGRYDRPWGPERPIFGTVRYMTSDSAVRKLRLREYLRRYGEGGLF